MCATPRVRSRWAAATPGRPSRPRSASAYSLPLQALVKLTSATANEAGAVASLRPSAGFMVDYVLPFREQFNMSCGHSLLPAKQARDLRKTVTRTPLGLNHRLRQLIEL